jgi:hypothetical protein
MKHNKQFHKDNITENTKTIDFCVENKYNNTEITHNTPESIDNNKCIYCNKIFSRIYSVKRHSVTCRKQIIKNREKTEIDTLKIQLINQDKIIIENKDDIKNLKDQLLTIMNTLCKIHPKTFNKINKQINNNITNNNITNNIINNNIIYALGQEDLSNIFTKQEKIDVLPKA